MHHSGDRTSDFSIRIAAFDDAAVVAALQRAARQDCGSSAAAAFRSPEDVGSYLVQRDAGAFIAWRDEVGVGTISFVADGAVVRLFGLAVEPGSRHHGVGSALVAAMEDAARARDAAVVHVQAAMSPETVAWFERKGYAVDGEEADVALGERVVMIDLVKVL